MDPLSQRTESTSPSASPRRRSLIGSVAVTLAAIATMAACGSGDDGVTTDVTDPADPISITELLDRESQGSRGENVVVTAFLFDDGSGLRLCGALAESFPPQCAEGGIAIRNPDQLDVLDVEMEVEQGVRWTDRAVWVVGWIEDGEFVVT